jgi:endonuclease IV
MISLNGCSAGMKFSEINSGGIKKLGHDSYYVNVESDYGQVVERSKTAFNAASLECAKLGKDVLVVSQKNNSVFDMQLIFKCINTDEIGFQQQAVYMNMQEVKMGFSANMQAQKDKIAEVNEESNYQHFPL